MIHMSPQKRLGECQIYRDCKELPKISAIIESDVIFKQPRYTIDLSNEAL